MRVVVTGATGFVGRHLVPALLAAGHAVRATTRNPSAARAVLPPGVEVVAADAVDPGALAAALRGAEVGYFLVHSMEGDRFDFEERDRVVARHYTAAAAAAGLRRVVFLGGLGDDAADLSAHLRSRHEVGDILRAGPVPATELRAGLVIGAGSASYVMLQQLVERLPVMITPRWVRTRTQPIAVDDVVAYLVRVLDDPTPGSVVYEIGGPDVMDYRTMMARYARWRGLRRLMLPVPVLTPRLSSYWVDLVTDVPAALARPLIEGLRNETVVRDARARRVLGPPVVSFEEALRRAGAGGRREPALAWLVRVPRHVAAFLRRRLLPPVLADEQVRVSALPAGELWRRAVAVGGREGYPALDWAWRLRGAVDRMLGGPGLDRSGPTAAEVRPGDRLDFWEVVELDPGRRLRLRARMKVPGDAELEIVVGHGRHGTVVVQTARFRPAGALGRLYWYALHPIHRLVFRGMADRLVASAGGRAVA